MNYFINYNFVEEEINPRQSRCSIAQPSASVQDANKAIVNRKSIEKAQNGEVVFSIGSWFLQNSLFFADFHKNTKEVPTKISKKKFFLFHRNVKKTKEIFFITVLSFFYEKITRKSLMVNNNGEKHVETSQLPTTMCRLNIKFPIHKQNNQFIKQKLISINKGWKSVLLIKGLETIYKSQKSKKLLI